MKVEDCNKMYVICALHVQGKECEAIICMYIDIYITSSDERKKGMTCGCKIWLAGVWRTKSGKGF